MHFLKNLLQNFLFFFIIKNNNKYFYFDPITTMANLPAKFPYK